MFPSDLFGNFYLTHLDQVLSDMNIQSVRYVDDIYMFVPDLTTAETVLRRLTGELRAYDLWLNEAKSYILSSNAIMTEEPDLEDLFQEAVDEVREQLDEEDFDIGYGFQSDWDDNEAEDEEGLELRATEDLLDNISEFRGNEEKIERFCLPIFTKAGSNYAVRYVIDHFKNRPSMTQIYCSYLHQFVRRSPQTQEFYFDWQIMWIFATLLHCDEASDKVVKQALGVLRESSCHDALRAVAAVVVGKFGTYSRRKSLVAEYSNIGSPYVQGSLLYASRHFSSTERRNAVTNWAGHSQMHRLIAASIADRDGS